MRESDSRERMGGKARTGTDPAIDSRLHERVLAAERERDALRDEVAALNARCRALEDGHAQVRDRIAWALDSLRNVLDGKG